MVLHLTKTIVSFSRAIKAWVNERRCLENIQKGGSMTRNQLVYWQNVETERSNRAREAETHRANVANETEINRHNVVTEQETNRHNLAIELLTKQQYDELARHNRTVEAETLRSNLSNEDIKRESNAIGYANLAIAQQNADTNRINSDIGRLNAATNAFMASENARHNQAMERFNLLSLQQSRDLEQQRIDNTSQQIDELGRHNLASESNEKDRIAILGQEAANRNASLIEQVRSNLAREQETRRHNESIEPSTNFSNYAGGARDLLNIGNDALNSAANLLRSLNPVALLGGTK